eukprot:1670428-Heterocapsa_arctica.AAC.1
MVKTLENRIMPSVGKDRRLAYGQTRQKRMPWRWSAAGSKGGCRRNLAPNGALDPIQLGCVKREALDALR